MAMESTRPGIRVCRESDLEAVLEARHSASRIARGFLDDAFFSAWREDIRLRYQPGAEVRLAGFDGHGAGLIALCVGSLPSFKAAVTMPPRHRPRILPLREGAARPGLRRRLQEVSQSSLRLAAGPDPR